MITASEDENGNISLTIPADEFDAYANALIAGSHVLDNAYDSTNARALYELFNALYST